MKKTFILIVALCVNVHFFGLSQVVSIGNSLFTDSLKMPNDQIVVNLLSNTWLNSPANMKLMPVSIGAEVYVMNPLIGKKSALSLAIGFGVGANNIHNNCLPYDSLEVTYFSQIPGNFEYEKNKITTAYVDIPVEIRFRTKPNIKNRNFKVALGGKFGYLISNYIKYRGEDFKTSSNKIVKFKEYNINNVLPFRYGAFLRVGYGKINFIVNYTLSSLFEKNKGPDVIPVSFGFSFTFL
ncbi:MAG: hypothetical protein COX07_01740 [Bacteroidetes bacterium CG23_combo_of_CG06-09_8_20_14_all_32_9]|nr:MAG: hypothetical protein COX07_01740 [Bacteroidetes bacterium CG23_combo_of_CG06-09_8_20_14_all_32_9]